MHFLPASVMFVWLTCSYWRYQWPLQPVGLSVLSQSKGRRSIGAHVAAIVWVGSSAPVFRITCLFSFLYIKYNGDHTVQSKRATIWCVKLHEPHAWWRASCRPPSVSDCWTWQPANWLIRLDQTYWQKRSRISISRQRIGLKRRDIVICDIINKVVLWSHAAV